MFSDVYVPHVLLLDIMPNFGKKKPFSGKAKKAQLQEKRERKALGPEGSKNTSLLLMSKFKNDPDDTIDQEEVKISGDSNSSRANKYRLKFKTETKKEIAENREKAMLPIVRLSDLSSASEMYFDSYHDFPRRPDWSEDWSKDKLERNEQRYFRQYVDNIMESSGDEESGRDFSYFELNIETWRQMWRVIEMSDIVLMILDVRYATATFPPALYDYIVNERKKHFILVLNKCDLIAPELSVAWKRYFTNKFPELHVIFFTSFPSYNSMTVRRHGIKIKRLRANFRMAKEGALQIQEICQTLTKHDLSSWKGKINGVNSEEVSVAGDGDNNDNDESYLTLGTLGHPNVGKSSLINSLIGKKRVSVSKTPGHTKHFQTLFLTKNVRLCDCPGLVFPSKVPKPLQVLMGSFPISQVREPYSVVNFLAERLDLPDVLKVILDKEEEHWSAFLICQEWAELRRFFTTRTSRPDTFRAANEIMRMALEGKLCLAFQPPGYVVADFKSDPETVLVKEVLGWDDKEDIVEEDGEISSEDNSESELAENEDNEDECDEEEERAARHNPFSALTEDCD